MARAAKIGSTAVLLAILASLPPRAAPVLDYDFFKTRVEPIFLEKRAGHVRCYVCHAESDNAFRLERLPLEASFWTEEQSRRNFEIASGLVVPGSVELSPLLMHPLAPEAGGDAYHSGGRQFESKNDPDWLALARWTGAVK